MRSASGRTAPSRGELVGTRLGPIGAPLDRLCVDGGAVRFDLPSWQSSSFLGEPAKDGTPAGVLRSEQDGVLVVFPRNSSPDGRPRAANASGRPAQSLLVTAGRGGYFATMRQRGARMPADP